MRAAEHAGTIGFRVGRSTSLNHTLADLFHLLHGSLLAPDGFTFLEHASKRPKSPLVEGHLQPARLAGRHGVPV
ncbi:hypothetical protein GLOTRDRAFT_134499 [Gloeophyllum trabeum ATCC 11539]|uniref:Uncharacterized protein n=1 Tax=Gloeophyllum trabeum (strain ATCC 11539 / FP-39264 / Madison 617) TaxID=670483 RepID=S7PPR8_GLOTA|nr:uncharacterized protein GLOTRDRAFT_134499 [Gloeophyllum trabeum ATCC 11539]EPQ49881.1 hypothetical protein GLOTRDRAFT_134499 [Gloeophyllum trabeum ATCC 11539]